MTRILGLMTCFNRKEKTVRALNNLIEGNPGIKFSFIVVDDGSTDGTIEALAEMSEVEMIHGNGKLFYSGGMRLAIDRAKNKKESFEYCLLFNDDVNFAESAIEKLCAKEKEVIWVGPTCNEKEELTYGGVMRKSWLRPKTEIVMGKSEDGCVCDTFNANCVLIPWDIFENLDNLDDVYTHSMGDFDYGFAASKKGYVIKVSNEFVGVCPDNPMIESWRNPQLTIRERIRKKESPKGLPKKEWFYYLKKNYNVFTAIVYSIIPYARIILKR